MRFRSYRRHEADYGPYDADLGVVASDGVRPLTRLSDFYADPAGWQQRAAACDAPPLSPGTFDLAPPVPPTAKLLCAAINYRSHGEETGFQPPKYPNLFARWTACLSTDGADVPVPVAEHHGLDWEVELAVIVGRPLYNADAEQAQAAILGYTVFNDISGRVNQGRATRQPKGQWALGKNGDASAAIGSDIVTADSLDADNLRLGTRLNGEIMQDGNTRDMIFGIAEMLAFASRGLTLQPGDLLATGTPAGVGVGRDPPRFMQPGDKVEAFVDGVGSVTSRIVSSRRGGAV